MKLFDVKDDCFLFSVFSRDFTKAFGFTLVLSFLSRQKKKRRKNGAEKTKLNHGQSPFCPFGVCLKKTTKNNNKKNLVMDSRQTPGCVTIHGKTDFESRKPDLMLLKPERMEAWRMLPGHFVLCVGLLKPLERTRTDRFAVALQSCFQPWNHWWDLKLLSRALGA